MADKGPEIAGSESGEFKEKFREAYQDKEIDEKEKREFKALSQRLRSLAKNSPEAREAVLEAVRSVAEENGISNYEVVSMIWDYGKERDWFLVNLKATPEFLQNAEQGLVKLEEMWEKLKGLDTSDPNFEQAGEELLRLCYDLNNALEKLSDSQIESIVSSKSGFKRIAELYFAIYEKLEAPRGLAHAMNIIAIRAPELIEGQVIESRLIERASGIMGKTLGQRSLFFDLARSGPMGTGEDAGKPYMHYAWYSKMNKDIQSGVFGDNIPQIRSNEIMELYNSGGFELCDIIVMASKSKNPKILEAFEQSQIIERMFLFATFPSPRNGHVSLSAHMMAGLASIAENNPDLLNNLLDKRNPELGQTFKEFIRANSIEGGMPFITVTDPKRGPEYSASVKRLRRIYIK